MTFNSFKRFVIATNNASSLPFRVFMSLILCCFFPQNYNKIIKCFQHLLAGSPANFSVIWQIFAVNIENKTKQTVDDAFLAHEYSWRSTQNFRKSAPFLSLCHAKVRCLSSCESCEFYCHSFTGLFLITLIAVTSSVRVHSSLLSASFYFLVNYLSHKRCLFHAKKSISEFSEWHKIVTTSNKHGELRNVFNICTFIHWAGKIIHTGSTDPITRTS